MRKLSLSLVIVFCHLALGAAQAADGPAPTTVTLLFTNDVESAYDPIPAFWLDDQAMIGGIAEMTTLINSIRESEPNVFLFDSGDIFTGALAKLTEGRLAFELMITMGYDAMAIGNHEFEYGHDVFAWQKNRAPFPVLGANFFYRDTDHPYAQAHAVIERNGVRIGVIGIMGQDAVSAIIPSYIAPLDVTVPAEAVQRSVDELRDEVDLVVLLTHQGKTAPMQTDAESDPRLQRDIDADIALAGAVTGVDVLFAGHADAGTPEPVVHPETGTLIMQTYGQATHLGYLQIVLDPDTGTITDYDGRLIPVDPARYEPDPEIVAKLTEYRNAYPELREIVGRTAARMNRRYIEESDIGNLFADALRAIAGTDAAFFHSGGLRKDLPGGEIRLVDLLDAYPFVDDVIVKEMSGAQIRRALEQSLTFERGLLQLAGLDITYDLSLPAGQRLVSVEHEGLPLADSDRLTVAAAAFLAEGGDLYTVMPEAKTLRNAGKVIDALIAYFARHEVLAVPPRGRQIDIGH
ncbi:MAG: bifunctional UDP-sugar hydrolase/5'-nucleotidase [Woeseiaceae bacterium]|jgi:2',3'-cyclic-nucleotide 2'-phosphodiesterase (5'-nucleotidase family)|nr:bifunctional UDP-sugar hydrolase/5'-nucleotidase [Woeseiaceae bacterium]